MTKSYFDMSKHSIGIDLQLPEEILSRPCHQLFEWTEDLDEGHCDLRKRLRMTEVAKNFWLHRIRMLVRAHVGQSLVNYLKTPIRNRQLVLNNFQLSSLVRTNSHDAAVTFE